MKSEFRKLNIAMFLLIGLFLTFTIHPQAQTLGGKLHGQVTDPTGALIPGAKVAVKAPSGKVVTATTNGTGFYNLDDLPAGRYTVSISAKGFATYTQNVEISAGADLNIKATLKINPVQMEIIVQGKEGEEEGHGRAVGVSANSNANATIITGHELDYLSDDPSELGTELLQLAGPTAGPNGGQVYVDGFASGYLPPKISIREIRINQNPFAAEQDKLNYGRVDVYTKPGSTQYHGQLAIDESNGIFNSINPYAGEKLPYNSDIFTGDFMGPVRKNLTGYFSFQRRNTNDLVPVNAFVLDNNLNQVPFQASLPHPDRVTVLGTRFDYQPTQANTVILRYLYTNVTAQNNGIAQFNLPSQGVNTRSYEHRFQLSDNVWIGARAENDTRFEFKRTLDAQNAAVQGNIGTEVTGAFVGGGNPVGTTDVWQEYYELQNHTLLTRGQHVIKFGGRMRTTNTTYVSTQLFNGNFIFDSLDAYQITQKGLLNGLTPAQIRAAGGGASQFEQIVGNPVTKLTSVDVAAYVQDEWRVRPNFNASYGLRYETQNVISDYRDFAPRVSLAWGIHGGKNHAPKTVLRTGFGIFYDRLVPNLAVAAKRLDGVQTQQILVVDPDFFPNLPPGLAGAQLLNPSLSPQRIAAALPFKAADEGIGGSFLPSITQIAPNFKAPYVMQTSVALERQIGKAATLSTTYLYSRGVHGIFSRNVNAPLPGSGVRPLGTTLDVYQYQSEGTLRQQQMIVNLNMRTASRVTIIGRYTLNFADSNFNLPGTFPSNQYDPSGDYGRSLFDIRHRVFLGAHIDLPHGFRASPFMLLNSGTPFNITTGDDRNGDSIFNDRPAFATDLSRPSVVRTHLGNFDTDPLPGQTIIPLNYGTGPTQFIFNMRFGKTFTFGERASKNNSQAKATPARPPIPRYAMSINVLGQNLFKHLNSGPPVGELGSPLFGQSNTLAGPPFSSQAAVRRFVLQTALSF